MSKLNPKVGKGIVETVLHDDLSDEEMDRALADRRDQVEAKLKEARDDRARGDVAPLEPVHVFLHEARERFKAAD